MTRNLTSLGDQRQRSGHEPALAFWQYLPHALEWLRQAATRTQGMAAIARLGEAAMPALLDLLHDDDPDLRRAAAFTLGRVLDSRWARKLVRSAHWTYHTRHEPGGAARLLDALIRGSRPTRVACAVALGRMGEFEAVPELIELLADDHRLVRLAAIWALGRIGADEAMPHLQDALEDRDGFIRQAAEDGLRQIMDRQRLAATLQLVADLSGSLDAQEAARRRLQTDGAALRDDLLALLRSDDPQITRLGWEIGHALWLARDHEPAIPALVEMLREPARCWLAADYADYLGRSDDPAITAALADPEREVRLAACYYFQRGSGSDVPALAAALPDPDPSVRLAVIKALARIGDTAGIKVIQSMCDDAVQGLRTAAWWAIRQIAARSGGIPGLVIALSDPDPDRRVEAASALGQYAATHTDLTGIETAAPALVRRLDDPEREVRMAAAYALGALGDPAGIEDLVAALNRTDDTGLRLVIVKALGKIGDAAAIPTLDQLARSEESRCLTVAAHKALGRIGVSEG